MICKTSNQPSPPPVRCHPCLSPIWVSNSGDWATAAATEPSVLKRRGGGGACLFDQMATDCLAMEGLRIWLAEISTVAA